MYLCTGNPLPRDIDAVLDALLNQSMKEATGSGCACQRAGPRRSREACAAVRELQDDKGVALVDVVKELLPLVLALDMPRDVRTFVLDRMAQIECVRALARAQAHAHSRARLCRYNLSFATSEHLQLSALVGTFAIAREMLAKSAS